VVVSATGETVFYVSPQTAVSVGVGSFEETDRDDLGFGDCDGKLVQVMLEEWSWAVLRGPVFSDTLNHGVNVWPGGSNASAAMIEDLCKGLMLFKALVWILVFSLAVRVVIGPRVVKRNEHVSLAFETVGDALNLLQKPATVAIDAF
jgi:hypothetical protein